MSSKFSIIQLIVLAASLLFLAQPSILLAKEVAERCAVCGGVNYLKGYILIKHKVQTGIQPTYCPFPFPLIRQCNVTLADGYTKYPRDPTEFGKTAGHRFTKCSNSQSANQTLIEAWRGGPWDGGLLIRHPIRDFIYYPVYDSVLYCFSGDDFMATRYGKKNDIMDIFRMTATGEIERSIFRLQEGAPHGIHVIQDGVLRHTGGGNIALYGLEWNKPIVFGLLQLSHSIQKHVDFENGDVGLKWKDKGWDWGTRLCFSEGRWHISAKPERFNNLDLTDDKLKFPKKCDTVLPIIEPNHEGKKPPTTPVIWPKRTCLSHGTPSYEGKSDDGQLPCCGDMVFGQNGVCRDRGGMEVDPD